MNQGVYKARVVGHRWRSAKSGSLGLEILLAIMDETGEEEQINATIWMTPKAMGMARHQLKELKFDVDAEELSALDDEHYLADRECTVTVKLDEYYGDGRLKAEIGGRFKPQPEDLKAAQAGLRAAKRRQEVAEENQKITGTSDDEIPF